jgi:hypothetical protein
MNKDNFDDLRLSGVTSFPFLKSAECQRLLSEASAYTLTMAQKEVGNRKVRQNFFEATVQDKSPNIIKAVSGIQKYIYETMIKHGGPNVFAGKLNFQEVRLHRYPVGGLLDFHRDDSVFKNLIVNVLLKGESCFYVADNTIGENQRLIEASVGWCTVIVAPGLFGETRRPPHCVAGVQTERWTLGMRDGILTPVHG